MNEIHATFISAVNNFSWTTSIITYELLPNKNKTRYELYVKWLYNPR